jgi:hypothetical protein
LNTGKCGLQILRDWSLSNSVYEIRYKDCVV